LAKETSREPRLYRFSLILRAFFICLVASSWIISNETGLLPHTLPFTFTGVDYFGPIEVAVGRRREKRWGVLFTCLKVRAVHLELVPSLLTDSFLLALKLFIARRGVPLKLLSDNGTNFRGASRVLAQEIERISTSAVENKYPEMSFTFIPPESPHMGGSWEHMVRSTKSILTEILSNVGLREEDCALRWPMSNAL